MMEDDINEMKNKNKIHSFYITVSDNKSHIEGYIHSGSILDNVTISTISHH